MISPQQFFTIQHLTNSLSSIIKKEDKKENLSHDTRSIDLEEILQDLHSGTYTPDPIYQYQPKGKKKDKKFSILSIRDKVVQQALVMYLNPLFEPSFLDNSYSYRRGRSSIMAADKVQEYLRAGQLWVLETDIEAFFPSIDHDLLLGRIKQKVNDERIINLICSYLKAPYFFQMEYSYQDEGISLGGIISPLLSNIYLHPLDEIMMNEGYKYVRFSDDLLVLSSDKEKVKEVLFLISQVLADLKLKLKKTKTVIRNAKTGFVFLGYRFDDKGRGPALKAIDSLHEKISLVLQQKESISKLLLQLDSVINGWSNYYGSVKWLIPSNFITFVVLVKQAVREGDQEWVENLLDQRKRFSDGNAELSFSLGEELYAFNLPDRALEEWAQVLIKDPYHAKTRGRLRKVLAVEGDEVEGFIKKLKIIAQEPTYPGSYSDLAELFVEARLFQLAQLFYTKAHSLEKRGQSSFRKELVSSTHGETIHLSPTEIDLFMDLFSGRIDQYAYEVPVTNQRIFYYHEGMYSKEEVEAHLQGERTLVQFLIRENNTVQFLVIDVDVSKKLLLSYGENSSKVKELIQNTQIDSNRIKGSAEELGLSCFIEDSGRRGRHCWFFFKNPLKAKDAKDLARIISRKAGSPSGGITWEIFPDSHRFKDHSSSQKIKLPLGKHSLTGSYGLFVDEMGLPYADQGEILRSITRITTESVEKLLIIERHNKEEKTEQNIQKVEKILTKKSYLIDSSVTNPMVKKVVSYCSLIRYLIQMVEETSYLVHQDRLTLLHVLAHLSDEGKDFLHVVMSKCLNYNYGITQKYIDRLPGKPISCFRIREKYQELSASLNCNCRFKLEKNTYPSPILHGIRSNEKSTKKDVELPVTSEIKSIKYEDPQEIVGLVEKLKRLKQQQQGIERSIIQCEQKLSQLFDTQNTDRLGFGGGTLVRVQQEGKTKWIIEL